MEPGLSFLARPREVPVQLGEEEGEGGVWAELAGLVALSDGHVTHIGMLACWQVVALAFCDLLECDRTQNTEHRA
jgi:hypothetical protein